MKIIHVCPANVATGGTESIHNFVRELDRVKDVDAMILYIGNGLDNPVPEPYKEYGCRYVTEFPQDYDGLIIFPEIVANMTMDLKYKGCIRAVNWLGIDAYAGHTPPGERGAFLADDTIIHLAQSDYAYDFLRKLGISADRIYMNVDVLNKAFFDDYEETERSDVVLYNPAKATEFTERIMSECRGIRFNPISGLSRSQVIDLMRKSKLYIDFGNFPGRERIPREAVMCGCCIIIGAVGSGRFQGDFDIPTQYRYERNNSHIFAIARAIRDVLDNYDDCRKDFDVFRKIIGNDRDLLRYNCEEFAYEVQHNHSRT